MRWTKLHLLETRLICLLNSKLYIWTRINIKTRDYTSLCTLLFMTFDTLAQASVIRFRNSSNVSAGVAYTRFLNIPTMEPSPKCPGEVHVENFLCNYHTWWLISGIRPKSTLEHFIAFGKRHISVENLQSASHSTVNLAENRILLIFIIDQRTWCKTSTAHLRLSNDEKWIFCLLYVVLIKNMLNYLIWCMKETLAWILNDSRWSWINL